MVMLISNISTKFKKNRTSLIIIFLLRGNCLNYRFHQESFVSEMERRPFKCLFWKANDSFLKLVVFIASGVSL